MASLVRYKVLAIEIGLVLFLGLLILTNFLPHNDNDEIIFQTLGISLANFESYSLQNASFIQKLPKMYDVPIFFRPPAFSLYLALWYKLLGTLGMYIAPVFVYLAICLVLYKTLLIYTKSTFIAIKAFIISLVSSLFLFLSTKILLDLFLALMITLSVLFIVRLKENQRLANPFLAGLFFVLAVLTKYTALVLFPFLLVLLLIFSRNSRFTKMFFFLLPNIILVFWFYFIFFVNHANFGTLLGAPDQEMLIVSSFVRYVSERPIYFYFLTVFLTNPLYFLLFLLFKKNIFNEVTQQFGTLFYFSLLSAVAVLVSVTLYGWGGGSYQMRYIVMAEPFLVIILSLLPFEKYKAVRYLFVLFAISNLLLVILNFSRADLFSYFELIKVYLPTT